MSIHQIRFLFRNILCISIISMSSSCIIKDKKGEDSEKESSKTNLPPPESMSHSIEFRDVKNPEILGADKNQSFMKVNLDHDAEDSPSLNLVDDLDGKIFEVKLNQNLNLQVNAENILQEGCYSYILDELRPALIITPKGFEGDEVIESAKFEANIASAGKLCISSSNQLYYIDNNSKYSLPIYSLDKLKRYLSGQGQSDLQELNLSAGGAKFKKLLDMYEFDYSPPTTRHWTEYEEFIGTYHYPEVKRYTTLETDYYGRIQSVTREYETGNLIQGQRRWKEAVAKSEFIPEKIKSPEHLEAEKTNAIAGYFKSGNDPSGPYTTKFLGSGQFGDVVEIMKRNPDGSLVSTGIVAKKMSAGGNNPKMQELANNELGNMIRLEQQGIGRVMPMYAFHKSGDELTLFMPKKQGDLESLFKPSSKHLDSLANRKHLEGELIRGLHDMHHYKGQGKGIANRDIKDANILFDLSGTTVKPYFADFGFSVKKSASADDTEVLGSPIYMAPEVLGRKSAPNVAFKSDTYSLGLVLMQVHKKRSITGIYSDAGLGSITSQMQLAKIHQADSLRAGLISKNVIDLKNPRERLFYDMLNPDPASRPTMAKVMERLKKIEADEARPPVVQMSPKKVSDVVDIKMPPKIGTGTRVKPRIFDPLPGFNKIGPYRYGWQGNQTSLKFHTVFDAQGRPMSGPGFTVFRENFPRGIPEVIDVPLKGGGAERYRLTYFEPYYQGGPPSYRMVYLGYFQ